MQSPLSDGPYAVARLGHFWALLSLPGLELGEFALALLQPLLAPTARGASAASAELPFAFDDVLDGAVDRGLDDLAELLRRRATGELEPPAQPLGALGPAEARRLGAPSGSLAAFPGNSLAQGAARRALRLDPTLDSSILEAWLLRGEGGRLGDQLAALFARARAEDARQRAGAALLPLVLLAFGALFEAKRERLRRFAARLLSLEALERASGLACFALVETACESALSSVPPAPGLDATGYSAGVRGLFSALSFCPPRADALATDLNPWELSASFAGAADRLWLDLLERDPSPRGAQARMEAAVRGDPAIREAASHAAAALLVRRQLFAWRSLHDGLDPELSADFDARTRSDALLFAALEAPRPLLSRLQRFARARKSDPLGEAATAALAEALRRGPEREDGLREVAGAYTCLALDRAAASAIGAARARLRDLRAQATREELVRAYTSGHLFRLSADAQQMRRPPASRSQGHLALDLSAASERALLAPFGSSAELMRRHGFERLAEAAAEIAQALPEGALALRELSAGAAAFAGEVAALVQLAQALRPVRRDLAQALRQHTALGAEQAQARRRELEAKLGAALEALRAQARAVEGRLAERRALGPAELELALWRSFREREGDFEAAERESLERREAEAAARWHEAREALQREEKEVFARVERQFGPARDALVLQLCGAGDRRLLQQLERRAAEAREAGEAERRALDEEARAFPLVDGGLFIDFGPEALSEAADPGAGPARTSLSESAARAAWGTAQSPLAKAKLEAMVRRARADKGAPGLEYPFRVFVDTARVAMVPPEVDALLDRALREREPAWAREGGRQLLDAVLRDLARAMGLGDGRLPECLAAPPSLYNAGEALSGEALEAFLEETSPGRISYRRELAVEELDAEFAQLFAFSSDELELAISVPQDGDLARALIFRKAGRLVLGRCEARPPTFLWELLRPDSPFVFLLQQKYLERWTAEERCKVPQEQPVDG